MSVYGDHMRRLLRPLDVYELGGDSLSGSELDAMGFGFDGVSDRLDYVQRESAIATAEGEGLDRWESLFASAPAHYSVPLRRQAIAALLRIGLGCCTLAAVNDTLSGCGITAKVEEKEQFGYVRVLFPEVAGIPEDFDRIREIILSIIPCHLEVEFYFRYLTWLECHQHGYTWAVVQANGWNWEQFQTAV